MVILLTVILLVTLFIPLLSMSTVNMATITHVTLHTVSRFFNFSTVVWNARVSIVGEEVIVMTGTLESAVVEVKAQVLTRAVCFTVTCTG